MTAIKARDHLGHEFPTMAAMARAYGLTSQALAARLEKYPLAEALTRPKNPGCVRPCADHLGRDYPSVARMAEAWRLPPATLAGRLKLGWDVQRALTTPVAARSKVGAEVKCSDHLGREYPSKNARAAAYGISPEALFKRLERGWTLEAALTTPKQKPRFRARGRA